MKRKGLWLAAVAGFIFTLAGAQPASADHAQDCRRKINKQENKLEREIHKHGWYSHQARHQREKLMRLRRECNFGFGWGRDGDWRDRDRDWRDDDRYRRDRDYRDDDRYDWRRDRDYHQHDPVGCRIYDHRHDRRGGIFLWTNGVWSVRVR